MGKRKQEESAGNELGFDRRNYVLFAVAMAVIIIGWLALARGSITFAPFTLVVGYCVLVPAAILVGIREQDESPRGK